MPFMLSDSISLPGYGKYNQAETVQEQSTSLKKFGIRWLFLFTLIFVVPYEWEWYQRLMESRSFFWYLSSIAGYRPNLIEIQSESGRWGLAGYASWGIAALLSFSGALIWTLIARWLPKPNYSAIYYWTRVLIRYRIALGIIAFGFLKVYPMQMPFPGISNLSTDFGDYNTYKIYWQHIGISTWYQILLGWVEVLAGVLLFFRSTVFLGALLNAGVLFNIAHANFAYDGGVHVYSSFFVLFALILLIPYLIELWKLYVLKQDVTPVEYVPEYKPLFRKFLLSAKIGIVLLFTVVYGALRYQVHYKEGYLKEPITPGLPNVKGLYNVTEFRLNDQVLPYDPQDSVRWQQVMLENWSTLVYKVNKPFSISLANGTPNEKDIDRTYELAGIGGGKRFLYYTIDSVQQTLSLYDKNKVNDRRNRGRVAASTVKKEKNEKPLFTWKYERPNPDRLILSGAYGNKDSIYVVLDRSRDAFALQSYTQ
jgi:hypothetical protein